VGRVLKLSRVSGPGSVLPKLDPIWCDLSGPLPDGWGSVCRNFSDGRSHPTEPRSSRPGVGAILLDPADLLNPVACKATALFPVYSIGFKQKPRPPGRGPAKTVGPHNYRTVTLSKDLDADRFPLRSPTDSQTPLRGYPGFTISNSSAVAVLWLPT